MTPYQILEYIEFAFFAIYPIVLVVIYLLLLINIIRTKSNTWLGWNVLLLLLSNLALILSLPLLFVVSEKYKK